MTRPSILCLAGDGWGAVAAFDALARSWNSIQVVSSDDDVISRLRPTDERKSDIASSTADYNICAGYKPIIPVEIINKVPHINIHYSLLPKYRGMHSTVWAILNGEEYCGCSIHLMNEYIDDGPLIAQFITPVGSKTSYEIMEECNGWIREHLDSILDQFLNGKIIPTLQDKSLATWVPKRNVSDCFIDFNNTGIYMTRMLRALALPYPRPRFSFSGKVYEIARAKVVHKDYVCTVGRVVNIDNEGIWVKIGDGLLVIQELLLDGKVIANNKLRIGMRLGTNE